MRKIAVVVLVALATIQFTGCGSNKTTSNSVPVQAVDVAKDTGTKSDTPQLFEPGAFENPEVCSHCHKKIYEEWVGSRHAKAWDNPWYQPDYLLAHKETDGLTDMLCGACHAPIAAKTGLLPPADGSKFDDTSRHGISCDFCHTVTGLEKMENMGHVTDPGNVKRGPRGDGWSLHHEVQFSEVYTKADFCGSCHMVIHPITGVHIIDTWQDWKTNYYGQQGIRCQDCHMTPTAGVSKRQGRAALMGKPRESLAFHGFAGGSAYIQDALGNARQAELSREFLQAAAEVKLAEQVTENGTLELTVDVHNVGAGHTIPTGTTYIRIMWLQVEIMDTAGNIVYRSGHVDQNNHVDPDAVYFRVLFKDKDGNLTGKSWRAHGIGYDRRIPARGKESETYRITLPGKGEYSVTTRLMYRSFTQKSLDEINERTGQSLPPVQSIEMASAQTKVHF